MTSQAIPGRRKFAVAALALLCITYLWLAIAPATVDSKIVLATAGGSPDWLLGPLRVLGAGYLSGASAGWAYFTGLLVAMALYAVLMLTAREFSFRTLMTAIVALHVLFLLAPPLLSQDVFSYIAYARLPAEHGLNPYAFAPTAIPLDAVFPYAGSKAAVNVYGPFFTLASYPLGKLSVPLAFWLLKVVACCASLGIVWLVAKSARLLGHDPRLAVVAVGLSPITLVHIVGGAHNEALTMLLVTLGVWLMLREREALGGFAAAAAAGVKASAVVPLPFMLIAARARTRTLLAMLGAGILAGMTALGAFGSDALAGLNLISSNQNRTSSYSLPHRIVDLADQLFGSVDRAALADLARVGLLAILVVAVCWLLWRTWQNNELWIANAGWATLGVLLASAWLVPWYLLWVLPFAALANSRRLLIATTIFSTYTLAIAIPF